MTNGFFFLFFSLSQFTVSFECLSFVLLQTTFPLLNFWVLSYNIYSFWFSHIIVTFHINAKPLVCGRVSSSFFLNSSFTVLCISQVFGLETKSLTSSYILSLLRNTAVCFILNIKGISCALLFRICLIRHFCVGLPYCWCSLHFWLI